MSVTYCPACGTPLPANHGAFCPACQTLLPQSAAPQVPGATGSAPAGASVAPPRPAQPARPPRPAPAAVPGPFPPAPPPQASTPGYVPPAPAVPPVPYAPAPPSYVPAPAPPYPPAIQYLPPPVAPYAPTVPLPTPASAATAPGTGASVSVVRTLAVSGVFLALLLGATAVLWQSLALVDPASTGDSLFSWAGVLQAVQSSHVYGLLPPPLFSNLFGYIPDGSPAAAYQNMLYEQAVATLFVALIPLASAASFWYGLARSPRLRWSQLWFGAFMMNAGLFIFITWLLGAEIFGVGVLQFQADAFHRQPLWIAGLFLALPGLFFLALACALACGVVGTAAAALAGGRGTPQPMSMLQPRVPPVFSSTGLAAATQVGLYALLAQTLMLGVPADWQWFPLAALMMVVAVTLWRVFPAPRRAWP